MREYILLIQGNVTSPPTDAEWEQFFAVARASGMFSGGSAIGHRQRLGNPSAASTDHIEGYMLFDTDDPTALLALLAQHPVVRHGGTVELCERPRD